MQFHLYLFFIKWIFSIHIKLSFIIIQICFIQYSNLKLERKKQNKNANMDVAIFHFAIADSELFFFLISLSCRVCHVGEMLLEWI